MNFGRDTLLVAALFIIPANEISLEAPPRPRVSAKRDMSSSIYALVSVQVCNQQRDCLCVSDNDFGAGKCKQQLTGSSCGRWLTANARPNAIVQTFLRAGFVVAHQRAQKMVASQIPIWFSFFGQLSPNQPPYFTACTTTGSAQVLQKLLGVSCSSRRG